MAFDIEDAVAARLDDWRHSDQLESLVVAEAPQREAKRLRTKATVGNPTRANELQPHARTGREPKHSSSPSGNATAMGLESDKHTRAGLPKPAVCNRGALSTQGRFDKRAAKDRSASSPKCSPEISIWSTSQTIKCEQESYGVPGRRAARAGTHRAASRQETARTYDSIAELLAETRKDIGELVKHGRHSRKRIDWFAYRGPMIPRKILCGLRAKQKERERRAKALARAAGLGGTRHRSRRKS